jgi:hypothetical protein
MSLPPVLQNLDRPHTIIFTYPSSDETTATCADIRFEALDAGHIRNIANYSKRLKRILEIDIRARKTESIFVDWHRRCDATTTRQFVMMIAGGRGEWPKAMAKNGRSLIQLSAAFQEFDCEYEDLCLTNGFLEASRHLIFNQDLNDPDIAREKGLHALVRGVCSSALCTVMI